MNEKLPINKSIRELGDARAGLLFRALLEQTQDQVYFKDLNSKFVWVSDVMLSKYKLESMDDLLGKSDFDFFSREHAQKTFEEEQRLIRDDERLVNYVEKEIWPDGRITYVTSTKVPLRLDSGEIVGILGITRDITDEVKIQHQLEESRALLLKRNAIMEEDLQSARTVQRMTIPGLLPDVPFADVAVSITSLNEVCGDLVTFPLQNDRRMSLVLGDISGHGVTAGLFTMLAKHLADFYLKNESCGPDEALFVLDRHLEGLIPEGFLTAVAGVFYRKNEDELYVSLASSCQPPVLWYRSQTQEVEIVKMRGEGALGLGICDSFECRSLRLSRGDCLLFATDGATELENPDGVQLGVAKWAELFRGVGALDTEEIIRRLLTELERFSGGRFPQDDTTLLAVRIK
ncbi:PP2C family protein-serine/threonine phosphatase [Pelagicoccus albus]|uniref:SpoIIE family protein phosphatase n=1 Tax=Pelagicoccus albus TaxID=415222 RepID=A0A7X1B972_9BACT|nr:SpoIIE family protein phosphatase [Pelagicoccus albus]MBC2608020.1 SpoIIE family protein phosphatase [Pelagicoccus albus]